MLCFTQCFASCVILLFQLKYLNYFSTWYDSTVACTHNIQYDLEHESVRYQKIGNFQPVLVQYSKLGLNSCMVLYLLQKGKFKKTKMFSLKSNVLYCTVCIVLYIFCTVLYYNIIVDCTIVYNIVCIVYRTVLYLCFQSAESGQYPCFLFNWNTCTVQYCTVL